ncbi:OmpA family protein [Actinomadura graeca]|uniref:OmpA family protein n=1 Tax=Actinomadura graeca TaxID=2750812 RepID=A0ABX8QYK7_9ACTN|nr:OmpA family protein [Actinomadura graeca]QXJ23426.1 OmpA family protein [Actinomadura graeca]
MASRRAVAIVAALCLATAGCSSVGKVMGIEGEDVDACDWLSQQHGKKNPAALDLVAVFDRSASMSGREDRKARDWYSQIFGSAQDPEKSTLVFDNGEMPTPASIRIGGFDGAGKVDWQPPISLPALGGRGKYGSEFARNTETCLRSRVTKAVTGASEAPGSDVLGAMASAGREGRADARRRKLIVVSDGLQTVGCADLGKLTPGSQGQAGRVSANCVAQGAVPDLNGWNVVLYGVGNPGKGWPAPRNGAQTWLTSLWSQLCHAAVGGSGRCALDTHDPDDLGKKAAEGVSDPVVPFKTVEKPPPERTVTLSSSLLFDTDKWELKPEGRRAIDKAMDGVDADRIEWVQVKGYTDSRGSDVYNKGLSRKRAGAVGAVLGDLRLKGINVAGYGEADQACSEKGLSGRALAAAQECNRRVEIKYKVRT